MKIIRNTKVQTITSLAFLLALVLTPALGLADNNKHDDRKDNKNNSCIHSFGQIFKNGWNWKPNHDGCTLPFGIWKKFPHATTTVDTVAPIVNSFTISANINSADAKWSTNEKTEAVLFYGTTTPVVVKATSTTKGKLLSSVFSTNNSMYVVDEAGTRTSGSITAKNLTASTTYYAVLAVRDNSGNVTISNAVSFTTANSGDNTAPVISNVTAAISANLLKISWKTDELATSKLFYGTTTLNLATSARVSSDTRKTSHSFEIPVTASTTSEHVILQSTDAQGNVRTSVEYVINFPF
ncbi:MAG: hypothetical protein V4576_04190 [Patescibacteria group bacterium]